MQESCYHTQKLKMSKKGVITLPTPIKEILNVSPGDSLEMFVEDNTIIIKAKKTVSQLSKQ